ncbi:MAG TPA: PepSY domain-containing protein [Pseudomonadales bacterium]
MRTLLTWHRWAGVIACLSVVAWSLSGVLHPIMSRLQPQPAARSAPAVVLPSPIEIAVLLDTHGIDTVHGIHPALIDQTPWLRIDTPDRADALYLNPDNGETLANAEHAHAVFLARHFSGEHQAAVTRISRVTAFDDEYPYVNRLLPVWRVEFDRPDHLRAFIDTAHSRLGTLTDDNKLLMSQVFSALHTWHWAEGHTARLIAMSLLLLATASTAIAGLVMAVRLRNARQRLAKKTLRRWHRRLAMAVSLSTMMFTCSGLYHLLHTANPAALPATITAAVHASDIRYWPAIASNETLSLHAPNGTPMWRIARAASVPAEHAHHGAATHTPAAVHYINTRNGTRVDDGEQQLTYWLAAHYGNTSAEAIQGIEPITAFAGEYGFINKRLPVMRANLNDAHDTSIYVETATDELAAIVTNADRAEGWSFAWLHKWHFMDIKKDVRDGLLALFALGNAVVALMGLLLFIRRG